MKNKKNKKEYPQAKYEEYKTKSRAGVEYTHHRLVLPENPKGYNYIVRKRLDAMNKKMEAGKRYYTFTKNKRIYNEK